MFQNKIVSSLNQSLSPNGNSDSADHAELYEDDIENDMRLLELRLKEELEEHEKQWNRKDDLNK